MNVAAERMALRWLADAWNAIAQYARQGVALDRHPAARWRWDDGR